MPEKKPAKPRVSLTKTQIQAGVGAELLALCQTVTEDGSLSKDEILALVAWLKANQSSDLPAVVFLKTTVERIIADGKVTLEERNELYRAIEVILPPEARKTAADRRKAIEAAEEARAWAAREADRRQVQAEKQREREERERNRSIFSVNFMVAGVHYENRPQVIERHAWDEDRVFLARDLKNRYSRNAVEVRLSNGMQIGFVPEDDAVDVAPLLDMGCLHHAYMTKILTGGRVPIPVVQAYLYAMDATVPDAISQDQVPAKQELSWMWSWLT
jgi:hypothetical protein